MNIKNLFASAVMLVSLSASAFASSDLELSKAYLKEFKTAASNTSAEISRASEIKIGDVTLVAETSILTSGEDGIANITLIEKNLKTIPAELDLTNVEFVKWDKVKKLAEHFSHNLSDVANLSAHPYAISKTITIPSYQQKEGMIALLTIKCSNGSKMLVKCDVDFVLE